MSNNQEIPPEVFPLENMPEVPPSPEERRRRIMQGIVSSLGRNSAKGSMPMTAEAEEAILNANKPN